MDALPLLVVTILVISSGVTCALIPSIKQWAWRYKAVACPDAVRRLHARPTPLWGGAGLFLGAAVAVAVACAYRPGEFVGVLAPFGLAAGVLWLVGMRDDIKPLSARSKLVCQIGIAFLIVQSGCYPENVAMLGYSLHLGWFGAVCMMGWLVLGINALNLIDGMDGLASVTGIVISAGIAIVAGIQGDLPTLVLALALAGGLAGFLVHNRPPATIFLGDSGSMVVGLALSFLAFRLTTDVSATIHVTSLTLLLFVPLLDTHLAVARRMLMGRNIFQGDHSHLHHQLLGKGLTVWKTLGLLGAFSGVSVAAACLAAITGRELAAWAMVLGSTGLLVAGRYLGVQELTLVRLALGGGAQRHAEMDLSSDPLSDVPDIIPMDRGLVRKPSQARPASADYESAEPSKQRSVA